MSVGLDLDQYQLRKRVLLVFAPRPEDARYEEQHEYLAGSQHLLDAWRVVTFGIFEDGPSFAEERPVSHEDSERARETFGLEPGDFGLRFIDLDGTEILRSSEPLTVQDLTELLEQKVV